MFQWINRDKPAPEALELEAKLQQLEVLEERYAEVQTEYVTLQNTLAAFKQRYWRRVGDLYARLDELRAEIARTRSRLAPRDPLRQAAVKAASSQARASAEAAREMEAEPELEVFEPTEELRKYYRLAAKIVHPDRADGDDDRQLRDEIMARINVAYRDGHVHTIQVLIDEYQMRARPGEDDAASRLIRTIRLISRIREQITEINEASATLRESGLYRLQRTVEEAEARGEDKLRVIERGIERDIEIAERELQRLNHQLAERYPELNAPASADAAGEAAPEVSAEPDATSDEAPQALTDEASAAVPMNSPAEVEIAVLLRAQGITYAYRQTLTGTRQEGEYQPAFTLQDRDGQPVLWEHLAHTEDSEQRARWQTQLDWYAQNGFDAGVNLFVTRDEADGSLNLDRLCKVAEYVASLVGEARQETAQ